LNVPDDHHAEVKGAVVRALKAGLDPNVITWEFTGADPRLIAEVIAEARRETPEPNQEQTLQREADARRRAAELPNALPAPDPIRSQWWFTVDSIVEMSQKVYQIAEGRVAFLGTPTVAHHYTHRYDASISLLDADSDVTQSLALPATCQTFVYDANDLLPADLAGTHSVAVIDPPWYREITMTFIRRARELVGERGFVLCVLPSRLTRPGLAEERTQIFADLLARNYEVLALNTQAVTYRVPAFEMVAYRDVPGFSSRPWRHGDLLVLRVTGATAVERIAGDKAVVETFSRNPKQFRVFLRPSVSDPSQTRWITPIPEFRRTVSARSVSPERVGVWSTDKAAAVSRDVSVSRLVLRLWADGHSPDSVVAELTQRGTESREARLIVEQFTETVGIWTRDYTPLRRRTPKALNELRTKQLSSIAAQPSRRAYAFVPDQFRLDFQRDRDRVLWSHALKRLANKTQLYPVDRDDHLRRRLSHSVEVMQLAATIARAFGLDPDLTEAGALAHDLGHTPFGHAGEHALNSLMDDIAPSLGGFNHYEHGADIVRWLEDVYRPPSAGGFPGLDLTRETVECVFKHMYHRRGSRIGQTELFQKSKHQDLEDTFGHLESQAVRIADKVSYFISDLEDGIRMNVIRLGDLRRCRLFERAPIDMVPAPDENLFDRFISQRRAILQVLMEDVIEETDRRLARLGSVAEIRRADDYAIGFSPILNDEVTHVWRTLQAGILHKDRRVLVANMQAAKIVTQLFLLFALAPGLADDRFQRMHRGLNGTEYMSHYKRLVASGSVSIPATTASTLFLERLIGYASEPKNGAWVVAVEDIIMAKDYVAGLTDTLAKNLHQELLGGT
jgi:dGTPase